jgi:hypothetical protein
MGSLTEIYKQLGANYTDTLKATQDAQANAIALDNARRAQQERMDLKALYAQQTQPSMAQLGAVSPEYAQAARKNELEMRQALIGMQHQQAQTGDIERKANEAQSKLRAQAVVPIVDKYNEMKASGMPEEQARAWFHSASGQAIAQLQQQGLIPKNFSYDANSITPEDAERTSAGLGLLSRRLQALQESSKTTAELQARIDTGVPMTSEQQYGSVEIDPLTGLPFKKPALSAPIQHEISVAPGEVNPVADYEAIINSPTAPKELKDFATQQIENLVKKAPSPFATSEQLQTKRVEQKANEEGAIVAAKKQAEEQQIIDKSLKAYETLPDISHIRNLVKGSIGSDIEYWTNRLGQTVGESLASGDIQAALAVVASDMANSIAFAPGSQSEPELIQRLKQVGDLDSKMTIDQKMSALDEWYQGRQRYIGKYGKYSDAELLDLGKEGKITHDTAMKVRANRKKGQ